MALLQAIDRLGVHLRMAAENALNERGSGARQAHDEIWVAHRWYPGRLLPATGMPQ